MKVLHIEEVLFYDRAVYESIDKQRIAYESVFDEIVDFYESLFLKVLLLGVFCKV